MLGNFLISVIQVMQTAGKGVNMNPEYVYYALVSPSEDTKGYKIANMSQYLDNIGSKDAMRLAKWWNARAKNSTYIHFYDQPDLPDMLHTIYDKPELQVLRSSDRD